MKVEELTLQSEQAAGSRPERLLRHGDPAGLWALSLCFLAMAFRHAAGKQLWMDEVLAVWTIRLPTAGMIWSAIYHGAEFSPPTYHLLLHSLSRIAGSSYLVLRVPSILWPCSLPRSAFFLLRRHVQLAAAAFAVPFIVLGDLYVFAIQVRPYALVVVCFALAILLWDVLEYSLLLFASLYNRCPARAGDCVALLCRAPGSLHGTDGTQLVCSPPARAAFRMDGFSTRGGLDIRLAAADKSIG